jgi:hypothetical protein
MIFCEHEKTPIERVSLAGGSKEERRYAEDSLFVLSIDGCPGERLLKIEISRSPVDAHLRRWIAQAQIRLFASHVRRNGSQIVCELPD